MPEELTVPSVALPPGVELMDQLTDVLEEPVTVAEKL